MSCKFHASMTQLHHSPIVPLLAALACAFAVAPAQAERADRSKPFNVVADQSTADLAKQVMVLTGGVTITKGTMVIKADRVELREAPDGYRTAVAIGTAARPATFRQKRDNVDEYIDGRAERLEYDDRADLIRFVNNAIVRRLRGTAVGDEITGNLITYDNTNELFNVTGAPNVAAAGSGKGSADGRVRAVLTPREGTAAAAEAAAAASGAPALKPSPTLGDRP